MKKGGSHASLFLILLTMDLSCLNQIIGITQKTCECLEDKPQDHEYDVSLSGYFIDDIEHGIPLQFPSKATGCGDDFWTVMETARSDAISEFYTDLLASIYTQNEAKYEAWSGQVGEEKSNIPLLTSLQSYIGMRIDPGAIRGGVLKLHSVTVWTDTAHSQDLLIYRNNFEEVHTEPFTSVAGVKQEITLDVDLPFYVNDVKQTYWILYQKENSKPYNVKFDCGCGLASRVKPYESFATFRGTSIGLDGGSLDIDTEVTSTQYTNGLLLNASLSCESMNWICFRDEEYKTDPFARVMAKTIQLYAIKKLINYVLNSGSINKWTLLDRKHLYGRVSHLKKEIGNRLPYLAFNLPDHAQDCLMCKKSSRSTIVSPLI